MPKPVLVVDDDEGIRTLIGALLRHHGYEAEYSADGIEAIATLRRRDYEAVVLDLMMPRASGFEVIDYLKADRPAMMRRLIVITAASDPTLRYFDWSRVNCLIRKPFEVKDLISAVQSCSANAEAPGN